MLPKRDILLYGITAALLIAGLEAAKVRYTILGRDIEMYVAIVAVAFTAVGVWIARKTTKNRKEVVVIRETFTDFTPNEEERERLGISRREMEVLQLMASGHSNDEIAAKLFISSNTVKTHTSSLYAKLDVKRRTQAVKSAKNLRLIP